MTMLLLLLVSTLAPRAARGNANRRGRPRGEGDDDRRRYRRAAHRASARFNSLHEGMAEVRKGGMMTLEQHLDVGTRVAAASPGRLLIWGLGFDSHTFVQLNAGGTTHFVEPDSPWYQARGSHLVPRGAEVSVYQARDLDTTVGTWHDFAKRPHRARSHDFIDAGDFEFTETCWDTIVVDSPNGHQQDAPGRAVPIYVSMMDVRRCIDDGDYIRRGVKDVVIYVHDFQRPLETALTRQFFEKFFRRGRKDDTATLEVIGDGRSKSLAKVAITLQDAKSR